MEIGLLNPAGLVPVVTIHYHHHGNQILANCTIFQNYFFSEAERINYAKSSFLHNYNCTYPIRDFRDLLNSLLPKAAKWNSIGIKPGLSTDELDTIMRSQLY